MRREVFLLLLPASLVLTPGTASAYLYQQSVTANEFADVQPTPPLTLSIPAAATAVGPATLTIEACGDFDRADEYMSVTVDGVNFGNLFNNDPSDDRFNSVTDSAQNYVPKTDWASITLGELTGMQTDGFVTVYLQFYLVNDGSGEYVTATLAYEATPEPATALLGLLALPLVRRRR
jgi:hypothetical protein